MPKLPEKTQEQVWAWCVQRWGNNALLKSRVSDGMHRVGFLQYGNTFVVMGEGKTWAEVYNSAYLNASSGVYIRHETHD